MRGKGIRGNKGGGGNSHDRAIKAEKQQPTKATEAEVVKPHPSEERRIVAPPLSKRPQALEYTIIRMGVPLGIAALGVGLMTANHFLSGIILLYLGLGLFALDIAYEPFFLAVRPRLRILFALIYVLAVIFASHRWIFTAAPLKIRTTSQVQTYGPGTKINGIEWQSRYSDFHLYVTNSASVDYDNFDAEVSTDLVMTGLVEVHGLGTCKVASRHQDLEVHWQRMQGNNPIGAADSPESEYHVVPLDKDGKPIIPVSGGDWSYRIRCDKIPANSEIEFFGALEVVGDTTSKVKGTPLWGPPKAASWTSLNSAFETSGRKREKLFVRCAIGAECEAP